MLSTLNNVMSTTFCTNLESDCWAKPYGRTLQQNWCFLYWQAYFLDLTLSYRIMNEKIQQSIVQYNMGGC